MLLLSALLRFFSSVSDRIVCFVSVGLRAARGRRKWGEERADFENAWLTTRVVGRRSNRMS
jgi:hypothetical protein